MNQPTHDGNTVRQILDDNDDELDNNQRELRDLTPQTFDSEVGQESLGKMVQFLRDKQSVAQLAADAVKNNPTLVGEVKDAILRKGVDVVDKVSRVLNFTVALESGAVNGFIRQSRGEGTVMDGVNEAIRENTGFGDTLKLAGFQKGPEFQAKIPKLKLLTPSQIANDIAQDVMDGKDPFELRPFGPVMSTRGAVGFGLDILLAPETYLSFGTNVPGKVAAKIGAKSILRKGTAELGAKSVARFAGKTLLTDKELLRGISALKSTEMGKGVLEALDKFSAVQIAKNVTLKDLGDNLGRKFLPDYGIHKPTADILEQADRYRMRDMEDGAKIVKDTFSKFTDEEKLKFADEMFKRNQSETMFRRHKVKAKEMIAKADEEAIKAGFESANEAFTTLQANADDSRLAKLSKRARRRLERIKFDPNQPLGLQGFSNPKFQKAAEDLVGNEGIVTKLAEFAGLPREILYENYIPGILDESMAKAIGEKLTPAKKKLLSSGRLRREFKIKATDPENAYITRMAELISVGHTRRALKNVIKRYGATYEDAMKQGFDEFFPKDAVRQFGRGPVFDRVEDLGLANKTEKVFLPNQIMETITEMAARQNVQSGTFLKILGDFTQQFKAMVTAPWPAFHSRNAFSNGILRFINEGWKAFNFGTNKEALQILVDSPALDTLVELGKGTGKQVPLRVIKKWAVADGISGTNQFMVDIGGKMLDQLSDREISGKFRNLLNPNMAKNDIVKMGRSAGSFIEDHAKMASYTQALKDGFSRVEAKQIVSQGLFDYGHLTSFEKSVMRRVFPFYTFSRKNLGAQMGAMLKNPGRQEMIFKLIKDLRDDALSELNPEQLEAFNEMKPNFLKSSFAVPAGFDKEGNTLWMTGLGLPQEDVLDLFNAQGAFFRLNPLIKLPANEMFRRLDDAGVITFKEQYTVKELGFLFKDVFPTRASKEKVMDWVNNPNGLLQHPMTKFLDIKVVKRDVLKNGKPTGEKDYSFTANPRMLDLLRNAMIGRHASTLRQFSDPNSDATQDMIRFMTGITIYNQNLERALRGQAVEMQKGVVDAYKENGIGYLFQRPNVTKDADSSLKRFNKRLGEL